MPARPTCMLSATLHQLYHHVKVVAPSSGVPPLGSRTDFLDCPCVYLTRPHQGAVRSSLWGRCCTVWLAAEAMPAAKQHCTPAPYTRAPPRLSLQCLAGRPLSSRVLVSAANYLHV